MQRESESLKDLNKIVERTQMTELSEMLNKFWQDPVKQRWLIDSEKLIASALDLFNKDPEILLNDKEYLQKMKEAQKIALEIQKSMQAVGPQQPTDAQQTPMWEWQAAWASPYNANPEPQPQELQAMQTPQPQQMDVASILKAAQE